MTRAQAGQLSARLVDFGIPHSVRFNGNADLDYAWSLELDAEHAYSTSELRAVFAAADALGLAISAWFAELGLT